MKEKPNKQYQKVFYDKNEELASCAGCDKELRINRISEEGLCKKCEGNFVS